MSSERFASAIAAIDSANASDPNIIELRGRRGPKEVLHAELVTDWVISLRPDADELLLLAARGHHLRRWTVPRSSEPAGRAGYLRWRKGLHDQHARELGEIIERAGYDAGEVARVQALVRKSGLGRDADAQTLEDALCLVFLETQLSDVAARLDTATLARVIAKTTKKMSEEARARIGELPLDEGARRTLAAAQTYTPVHGYLEALARQDWAALAATLAPDIDRMGPYRDRFVGREPYV
ncbi:MAG TPA: DUF4202 domain-containing protein, partial [Acidimicrobiia bacterium]|nr:DUF4202 domain-containing protein [Acidimicrobiia bacterium]